MTRGEGDDSMPLEIELSSVAALLEFVRSDHMVLRAHSVLLQRAMLDSPFRFVVGEAALELEYLNEPAFQRAAVRFMSEAQLHLDVFALVVVRVLKDRSKFFVDQALNEAKQPMLAQQERDLPFQVEPLSPTRGRLLYVVQPNGNGHYQYEVRDTLMRARFDFHVYESSQQRLSAPAPLLTALGNFAPALRFRLAAGIDRAHPNLRTDEKLGLLRSPFWAIWHRALELAEFEENVGDAEHVTAHTRPIYTMRPMREVAGEHLSTDALYRAESVTQAGQDQQANLAFTNWARGFAFHERIMRDQLPARSGQGPNAETKRVQLRQLNGRPDPIDDAIVLDETFAGLQLPAPTYRVDIVRLRDAYAQLVAEAMYGIPITELQASYTSRGGRTSESDAKLVTEPMDLIVQRYRDSMGDTMAWAYGLGMADVDLGQFNQILERLSATQRTLVAQSIDGAASFTRVLSRRDQKRLLQRALLNQRRPSADDDNDAAPTVGQLRELIVRRLAQRVLPRLYMVFESDMARQEAEEKAEMEKKTMPPKEAADDTRGSVDLLIKLVQSGMVSPESAIDAINKRLGTKLKTLPPLDT